MPIIGVIDSSKSGNLYANSYESIATTTITSSGTHSFVFTNIPQTYRHLQVRYSARHTSSFQGESILFFADSATGQTNYFTNRVYGVGSSAVTDAYANAAPFAMIPSGGNTANMFGSGIVDYLDYTNTNKFKVIRMLTGMETDSGNGQSFRWTGLTSGTFTGSAQAITNIAIGIYISGGSTGFAVNSTFALYGIK